MNGYNTTRAMLDSEVSKRYLGFRQRLLDFRGGRGGGGALQEKFMKFTARVCSTFYHTLDQNKIKYVISIPVNQELSSLCKIEATVRASNSLIFGGKNIAFI